MARPSTPLISRNSAAKAALAVIDEVGLSEFSLARVANRLGVRPPSLYHHFRDKDEVLEEVARLLLLKLPGMHANRLPYEERMVMLCVSARRSLLRHPKAALLMLHFFPRTLLLEAYDEVAADNPYPPEFHMAVLEATEKLTFGSALFAAAAKARNIPSMPAVNSEQYPMLARAIADNPFNEEELFAETVRLIFAGVAARYEQGLLGQPVAESNRLGLRRKRRARQTTRQARETE
ncbi:MULTISPECIES: TetR/AcrR family transcriptional regulator [unclassified Novosphingobium]|uniref:TetR/AcrR family transcriptional regulator n=1 Tax=unclassified Novosphingobium TaxID=2644732 RepID=UPI000D303A00|nr:MULTISPECIES: TetR/AcrR family transcriptional regulator [unclassified Novosphingobium]PTR12549.1 TetR family transcriptional regulator [Novosphingobium sp. GV055]PUB06333.1 TetR family transcriptional regulator [Novosphingobium sp. GV061]PUB22384.1 TetR family transcriptional regulator [Novosphingobium sp. GV079]PUB44409.1 TetR family transcriptional regulator [Novosphingobium sp. GV027]